MRVGQVGEITAVWQRLNSSSSPAAGVTSSSLSDAAAVYISSLKPVSKSDAKLFAAQKTALKDVSIRGNALASMKKALNGMADYASIASSPGASQSARIEASVKFAQSLKEVQRYAAKANYAGASSKDDQTFANAEATTAAQQSAWTKVFSNLNNLKASDPTAAAKVSAALDVVKERKAANESRQSSLVSSTTSFMDSIQNA